jgi:crotonobetainyl-CoA:carnitine CoA-transferase CaiB-like acyl-CoA transferase
VIAGQPAPPAVWIAELAAGLALAAFVAAARLAYRRASGQGTPDVMVAPGT